MATVHGPRGKDEPAAEPTQARPRANSAGTMQLQREGALLVAQASQIALRSMQDLARRQAEAIHGTVAEFAQITEGADGKGQLDASQRYLRASVLGFLTQLQLGLEAAAATSAVTLALLEDKLAELTRRSEPAHASLE
jgi:hypothetical protein